MPRGPLQEVLDSERFTLLRTLEFFAGFGDVELWEVVHRATWQRHGYGQALYRKGEEGNTFHIITQGQVEVYRDGQPVAPLGAGTSVGEMAYLAPSPELRVHTADVLVSQPATTVSFTPRDAGAAVAGRRATCSTRPSSACWCAACTPRTRRWPIRGASCDAACRRPHALRVRSRSCRGARVAIRQADCPSHDRDEEPP